MPDGSSNSAPIAPQATAFPPISEVKGRSVPTYWQGRREWNLDRGVDNMPNLWRVGDNLYDLAGFEHPGGVDLLSMSKGTDITEAFEAHHIDIKKARAVLDKYFVQVWIQSQAGCLSGRLLTFRFLGITRLFLLDAQTCSIPRF